MHVQLCNAPFAFSLVETLPFVGLSLRNLCPIIAVDDGFFLDRYHHRQQSLRPMTSLRTIIATDDVTAFDHCDR
jgi:hypothetical protein